jgi:DUF2075 family protein
MIVYKGTKDQFQTDVLSNDIENIVLREYKNSTGRSVAQAEINSWRESLLRMSLVLNDSEIPKDSSISIEYHIPQTSKRVDFIIAGEDEYHNENVVVVELKQWSGAELTEKDGIVVTKFRGRDVETAHPSYQAWSYCSLLKNFNETVYEERISLNPCAYLHNYDEDTVIRNSFYDRHLSIAPVFLKNDAGELQKFIKQFIKYGDRKNTMYRIDNGKIKPSKNLADCLSQMLKGNEEFTLIDEQKVIYENAIFLAKKSTAFNKNVFIIEGGPGTGKTVVAINLLVKLTGLGKVTKYVTKNAAPRAVYESKLTGTIKKTEISNLFTGSGAFINKGNNIFDALIVDEAHRLNEKSGMFQNLGENQVKEIIEAAKFSIFFIDEDQRVTLKDIGTKEEIKKWARSYNAQVHTLELSSQFRCNGSDGYLAWLDHALNIRETANPSLDDNDYDFKVIDTPNELRDIIFEKNKEKNKARLVAGYCWNWASKTNSTAMDIIINAQSEAISPPQTDFQMQWNLGSYGNLWIIDPNSVKEVGCIHTCQGLELDYIGVIIGDDLVVRNGQILTDPTARAKTDTSLKGYKSQLLINREETLKKVDLIIKNTYRTLMTRGMKGCYIYCTDKETQEYFRSFCK